MRFVEDDHAVEVGAQPCDDLVVPARLAFARLTAQLRISGEEHAFGELDRTALAETRQRRDEQALLPERRPVTLCVFEQPIRDRQPDGTAPAFQPVVEDDARNLAALARAGSIAEEPPAAQADSLIIVLARGGHDVCRLVDRTRAREMAHMGLASIDDRFELLVRQYDGGNQPLG